VESEQILNRLNLILQEDDKRDRLSKFLSLEPSIKLTSELKSKKTFSTKKQLKIFRKSKMTIAFSFLFVAMLWFGLFLGLTRQNNYSEAAVIVAYILNWSLTISVLWQFFYSDEYNFTMYIDSEGIQIDTTLYRWEDIEATAILHYPGKGDGTNKLVLLSKNDYWKFDLLNFYSIIGIAKTVSNYVEYFKEKNYAQH
jgi:hypothetical protein